MARTTLFLTGSKQYETPKGHSRRRAIASVAVLAILLSVACASTPAGKAYQSIATCNATAQSTVKAFGVLYQANKATDPVLWGTRYDKANAEYQSYQKIALAAVDAAKSGGETPLILAAVNEVLNQLVIILNSYGVK